MISPLFKKNLKFIFLLLILYIIIFEFIITQNKYIPQPTIFLESFIHLWTVYNFFVPLISTTTIVYLSILITFLFIHYFRIIIIKNIILIRSSSHIFNVFKYIPAFFIVIIFSLWFNGSLTGEIVFSFLVTFVMMVKKIYQFIPDVNKEYIIFAHQTNPRKMFSEVYWKSILPQLFNYLYELQVYLWVLILIYEFISESFGVGLIYKQAYNFNDVGAIFSISIIMSVVIWVTNIFIKHIEKKKIYWSS